MGARTSTATHGLPGRSRKEESRRFSDPNDVPPIGPGRPPSVPAARFNFDLAEKAFDALGLDRAAQHLRRYRSGVGGDLVLSREEASRIPLLRLAEDRTRNHFETRTFVDRDAEGRVSNRLRNLPDGGSTTIEAAFDGGINFQRPEGRDPIGYLRKIGGDAAAIVGDIPGYLALGKTAVKSKGRWNVLRRGNQFIFRGDVHHSLEDPFDFHEGQPGSAAARVLENAGEARPFTIRHSYTEPSSALAELQPDGRFRLLSARWGEASQP